MLFRPFKHHKAGVRYVQQQGRLPYVAGTPMLPALCTARGLCRRGASKQLRNKQQKERSEAQDSLCGPDLTLSQPAADWAAKIHMQEPGNECQGSRLASPWLLLFGGGACWKIFGSCVPSSQRQPFLPVVGNFPRALVSRFPSCEGVALNAIFFASFVGVLIRSRRWPFSFSLVVAPLS